VGMTCLFSDEVIIVHMHPVICMDKNSYILYFSNLLVLLYVM